MSELTDMKPEHGVRCKIYLQTPKIECLLCLQKLCSESLIKTVLWGGGGREI
jgi:hypothetical protein